MEKEVKAKEKAKENAKKEEIKEQPIEKETSKEVKPLVCSRILFVSVLDKIYMVIIALIVVTTTYAIFKGDTASMSYAFWDRVGYEIMALIGVGIFYLFLNWFYQCAIKTMMCLTEKEVYIEKYIPFRRSETSIPIDKVTAVSAINIFWIFRCIVIHRYHQFPTFFWTWNNQEFKDRLNELSTGRKEKVENEFQTRSIITKDRYKVVGYAGIGLVAVIVLIGIVRFFKYNFSDEKKLTGKYLNDSNVIELLSDGTCTLSYDIIDETADSCTWSYYKDSKEVTISYEYTYKSSYSYYSSKRYDSFRMNYDSKEKTLEYDDVTFKKK